MFFKKYSKIISSINFFIIILLIVESSDGLCIYGKEISCLTELSEEETNDTLEYVLDKYDEVAMKIMGQLKAVYGLRLTHGHRVRIESDEEIEAEGDDGDDGVGMNERIELDEEELNIHFKYVDNTPHDIIQNCVFVVYTKVGDECKRIETICNTFLPITPRPLMQRDNLRVCNDSVDVERYVENEDEQFNVTIIRDKVNNNNAAGFDDTKNADGNDEAIGDGDADKDDAVKTVDDLIMMEIGQRFYS